jgi:hypothetical protein
MSVNEMPRDASFAQYLEQWAAVHKATEMDLKARSRKVWKQFRQQHLRAADAQVMDEMENARRVHRVALAKLSRMRRTHISRPWNG